MKTEIKTTAEQFANMVQKQRIMFPDVDDREVHVDTVLRDNWPDIPRDELLTLFTLNTVYNKLEAMERDAHRNPNRWIETKQMSLFNEPEFKIPKFMFIGNKKKHYREVSLIKGLDVLLGFHGQTRKEAEELAAAWAGKDDKANMIGKQISNVKRLVELARAHGYDPEVLTFGDVEQASFKDNTRNAADSISPTVG